MAHATFDEVYDRVLFVGSSSEQNAGSAYMKESITSADLIIDNTLTQYDLSCSGSSDDLINQSSCYLSASYFSMNFDVQRAKENSRVKPKWVSWRDRGMEFLQLYIRINAKNVQDHLSDFGPPRGFWSSSGGNPSDYDDDQWS